MAEEFGRLYKSVFANPKPYIAVVTALGKKKCGMTRDEIVSSVADMENDGVLTTVLRNLETSGFVRRYVETGKRKKGCISAWREAGNACTVLRLEEAG